MSFRSRESGQGGQVGQGGGSGGREEKEGSDQREICLAWVWPGAPRGWLCPSGSKMERFRGMVKGSR